MSLRAIKYYFRYYANYTKDNVYTWIEDTYWDNEKDILYEKNNQKLITGVVTAETFKRQYLNGKLNGLTVNYDPHWGKFMKSELRYLNGEQHGIQRYYCFNGILSKEYSLSNGKKEGIYKEFDPKGRLRIERNYERGKLEGREIELTFYRNDALRITNWKMGKKSVSTGSGI